MASGLAIVADWKAGKLEWPEALKQLTALDWPTTGQAERDKKPPAHGSPGHVKGWQAADDRAFDKPPAGSLLEVLGKLPPDKGTELNNALYARRYAK